MHLNPFLPWNGEKITQTKSSISLITGLFLILLETACNNFFVNLCIPFASWLTVSNIYMRLSGNLVLIYITPGNELADHIYDVVDVFRQWNPGKSYSTL
jgi:hypothetical protein